MKIAKKYHRKIFHLVTTLPFVVLGFFVDTYVPRYVFIVAAIIMLLIFIPLDYYRITHKSFKNKLYSKFSHFYKESEQHKIASSIWGPINLLWLALFFSRPTIGFTLAVGSLSDPIASIIGMRYGKKKNGIGKTWEGTLGYFISALILFFITSWIIGYSIPIIIVVFACGIAALIERYVRRIDDNFAAPIVFAIIIEVTVRYFS